jgi:hypothetical protein
MVSRWYVSLVAVEEDSCPSECSEGYLMGLDASDWRFGSTSNGGNTKKRVAAACNDCGNIFKLRSLYNNGTSDCSIQVSDRL